MVLLVLGFFFLFLLLRAKSDSIEAFTCLISLKTQSINPFFLLLASFLLHSSIYHWLLIFRYQNFDDHRSIHPYIRESSLPYIYVTIFLMHERGDQQHAWHTSKNRRRPVERIKAIVQPKEINKFARTKRKHIFLKERNLQEQKETLLCKHCCSMSRNDSKMHAKKHK